MKKKAFKELKESIGMAKRLHLMSEWLSKFPSKEYFKSNTHIAEHVDTVSLYHFIEDATSGAR